MKYFMIGFATVMLIALLAGCSSAGQVVESIGVGEDDNAILCIIVEIPGRFTGTTVQAKRLEFPAGFDMSTLTAADIEDLENRLCR